MKRDSLINRVMRRIVRLPFSGCWIFMGATSDFGHGLLGTAGRGAGLSRAHRVSYEHVNGPVPQGLLVRHSCDVPCCVNPDHLEVGTQQDNVDDMMGRGRHKVVIKPRLTYNKLTRKEAEHAQMLLMLGYTRREVSAQVGLTVKSIARIERGETWQ